MQTTGMQQVHFEYKWLGRLDARHLTTARDAFVRAQEMLNYAVTLMDRGFDAISLVPRLLMLYYFKLDGPPSRERYDIIHSNLVLTRNGLMGRNLHIKVTNNRRTVLGSVNNHENGKLRKCIGPKATWTEGRARNRRGEMVNCYKQGQHSY